MKEVREILEDVLAAVSEEFLGSLVKLVPCSVKIVIDLLAISQEHTITEIRVLQPFCQCQVYNKRYEFG